ncbi:MAG: aspartate/glutamate racemase family protein [Planctomycetales bacterium]|nr:aspartate/glutamate racemase family protein [Planctomycetales bacterium]
MKTIGLLGGMSWQSTALYYRLINEETNRRLGGLHSAQIAMVSVDFQEVETHQRNGDWRRAGEALAASATQVEAAGAEMLLLCTNTMHKVADEIENAISIPFLHIADATAERIRQAGLTSIGLLGTQFTMEQDFYRGRLEQHGLKVFVPGAADREIVHRVIYEELCQGTIREDSRSEFVRIIKDLKSVGAEGVIQGCTEIVMLVDSMHTNVPLFDTTAIHAHAAVDAALE